MILSRGGTEFKEEAKGMVLALEGIRVVEVTTMAAAPMAGRLLGDWGAEVNPC